MYLKYYLEQLDYLNIPSFLLKYLKCPSLLRLKHIGYFCGMDYASKDVYNFSEYISRYSHSLTVSLLVYKLTKNKEATLAGLFHDVATPCFSHVIDYMNNDYEIQESTEEYTSEIMMGDQYLLNCLEQDGLDIDTISDFKLYPVVDNKRPKLCADRIDGVILTGFGWTKNINTNDIFNIVNDLCLYKNEDNEDEIGFKSLDVARKVMQINQEIDIYCHSNEDNYMMQLLAKITRHAIDKKYIKYEDLYSCSEEEIFHLLDSLQDEELKNLLIAFRTQKNADIPETNLPKLKVRNLHPLVNGKRI